MQSFRCWTQVSGLTSFLIQTRVTFWNSRSFSKLFLNQFWKVFNSVMSRLISKDNTDSNMQLFLIIMEYFSTGKIYNILEGFGDKWETMASIYISLFSWQKVSKTVSILISMDHWLPRKIKEFQRIYDPWSRRQSF